MTGTDELRQLRAENALLRQAQPTLQAQVATLQAALAAAQEQIAQLQTEVVRLAAERDQQKGPPAFVKPNTPPGPARGPRKKRAAGHNQARRREEPTQSI
jgi:hypothetical protein